MFPSEAFCLVKEFIFHQQPKAIGAIVVCSYYQSMEKLKEAVNCWKINANNIDDEDTHNI
jgi:hypothetical protein